MYLPQHNAVLVPAASDWQHSLSESAPPPQMVVVPPRRRRPLAAILKLIGGRIMIEPQEELSEIVSQAGIDIDKEKLENLRLLIKVTDQDPSLFVKTASEKSGKRSNVNGNHDQQTYLLHNLHRFIPAAQYIGSEIPEPETIINKAFRFAAPSDEDGFSYMYRYTAPQSESEERKKQRVEVSLQQGKNMAYPHTVNPFAFDMVRDTVRSRAPLPEVFSINDDTSAAAREGVENDDAKIGPIGPSLLSQFLDTAEKENAGSETQPAEREKKKTTSLILKPVARAVAGARGVAVAAPIARAILKKGEQVSLEFDPDAVAIAGPGGKAHAHPQFTIDYVEDIKEATANVTSTK